MLAQYPKTRKVAYIVFAVIGLVVGGFQVGFASLNEANPDWLTVALAVLPFAGAQLGLIALSNTPNATPAE